MAVNTDYFQVLELHFVIEIVENCIISSKNVDVTVSTVLLAV